MDDWNGSFWDMLAGVWLGFSCVVLKNQRPWCGAWRLGMAGLVA
jgi:hypothetical protein